MASVLLGRALDAPLDEPGEKQAQALAQHLSGERELLIHASPRRRTRQTAAAIAQRTQSEVMIALDLDEVDFGRWAGCTFESLAHDPEWRQWNERRDVARTPAGEAMADLQQRAFDHLERLRKAHPVARIAIVTHAEIIRAAVMRCLEMPLYAYQRIEISPASITTLKMGDWGVVVEGMNEQVRA